MSGKLKQIQDYLLPREKAQQKGMSALSDTELIQLIVGSGTSRFHVASIARRVVRLIKSDGLKVETKKLSSVSGLGPARVAQLRAVFELASRYPGKHGQTALITPDLALTAIRSFDLKAPKLWVLTLDGAARLIERRAYETVTSVSGFMREVSLGIVRDRAAHIIFVRVSEVPILLPDMDDLSVAKEARQLGKLLGLGSVEYLLANKTEHYSVMKELAHAP